MLLQFIFNPWILPLMDAPHQPDPKEERILAHQIVDDILGKPTKCTAAAGITMMTERIQLLEGELQAFIDIAERNPSQADAAADQAQRVRKELGEARSRLREYQAQAEGRN